MLLADEPTARGNRLIMKMVLVGGGDAMMMMTLATMTTRR
jgi:hypothetical protein